MVRRLGSRVVLKARRHIADDAPLIDCSHARCEKIAALLLEARSISILLTQATNTINLSEKKHLI